MNSEEYIYVIDRRTIVRLIVVHLTHDHYPDGDGALQHDLAPCHTSKIVTAHLNEIGLKDIQYIPNIICTLR